MSDTGGTAAGRPAGRWPDRRGGCHGEYSTPPYVEVQPLAAFAFRPYEVFERRGPTTDPAEAEPPPPRQGRDGRRPGRTYHRRVPRRGPAPAKGLVAAGVGAGDRVALMSRTRYEWTLLDFAIWGAGAVTVPVYETSSAEQVEWILGDSGAGACHRDRRAPQAVTRCGAGCPGVERVWLIEGPAAEGRPALDAGRRGRQGTDDELAGRRRRRRRPTRHHRLHLGHHRPPQGLRADPRQPAGRAAQRGRPALPVFFDRRGPSVLLFLPLAHVFARLIEVGAWCRSRLGHTADIKDLVAELALPAHADPGGAPGVREGLQRRRAAGRGERARARSSTRQRDRDRLEQGAGHGRPARRRASEPRG